MAGSRLEKLGSVFTRVLSPASVCFGKPQAGSGSLSISVCVLQADPARDLPKQARRRTRDLMRAGVKKQSEKPRWYDVYAAFPPKREPTYVSPPKRRPKLIDNVSPIFYKEDAIRAQFFDTYGSPGTIYLSIKDHKSICQRFVEKYLELQKSGTVSEDKLFEETGKALLLDGITLRKSGGTVVSSQPPPALQSQPKEIIKAIIDQMKPSNETDTSQPTS